jgi:hypothetical protein
MLSLFVDEKVEKTEEVVVKKPNPFEINTKIFKGNLSQSEYKYINEWLLLIQLSNLPQLIDFTNQINCLKIPKEKIADLIQIFSNGKLGYVPYPKKPKVKNERYLEPIKWKFMVSEETARRYIKLLTIKELKNIDLEFKQF